MFKKIIVVLADFFIGHVFYRVKYIDLDKMKNVGRCVVCSNHSNAMDPVWIYPRFKNMWVMAKAELFKNKLLAKLFFKFNIFPIRRGERDARSLLHAINILKNNDDAKLLIFPEGTRIKRDKERGRAKSGAVFIASKAELPIVPVYITKNPKMFHKVYVVFGDPIEIPKDIAEEKKIITELSEKVIDECYLLKDKIPAKSKIKK